LRLQRGINEEDDMIVVTGATGQLGRQVVERLTEMVSPSTIAVSVRDPEKAAGMAAAGIEVRKSDFTDHDSMVRAFAGADKVLMISTRGPDVVAEHLGAVAAAAAAGVPHVVYTSGTQAKGTATASVHKQTEDAIRSAGMTYTFLRNNLYADVLAREVLGAIEAGVLSSPAGDGRVGAVTRGDCAAVAASVLATSGHEDRIYDITGPDSVGWRDLVAIASEVAGHVIPYVPVSFDELTAGPNAVMADYYGGISRGGYDIVSGAVLEITGRPPSSAATFVRRTVREALAHRAAGV
jgi:NAD(P)H dehydrogenase (quinone)